ncbi:acetyl-CoA carboxylase biotin carboxylase subunit family protein [Streptomyces sp. CBMA156]|uniref:ATP-grasp domain-containing protein n=1 Tax=Streptomyces sp. CBMA156 TaxID=1930280 RepID=UPI001661ADCE|nr:ATP-grasp domain-containing protein [Streptomyces sp. CBMA156]MBD0669420.1 phosphoribosylglycinamide synthetase [Streptomyces sp. CBMA156]
MKSVLILSKWQAGGVLLAAEQLRARGLRSVLVSELADNRHRDDCDDHVLVDWDGEDVPALIARLDERGIVPTAVVSLIEALIPWKDALAAHYGLPGAGAGLEVLASKTLVRDRMRALGLSAMRYCGDPAEVDFFPAIVKPARDSAASRLVHRVDGPDELLAWQRHLADGGHSGTEMVYEEFLPGVEFSVDGPVVDGRFHPVLAVEKPDHDDVRHHDAGLRVHPPQQDHVRAGVRALTEAVSAFCADLRLDQHWLHVEGRSDEDGRTELVEINLRFGGGMYPTAIREVSGIDPMEAVVSMALGEFSLDRLGPVRDRAIVGWVDVEAEELGRVEMRTTEDDLLGLPGVIKAELVDGYLVHSLEQENYFIRFAMTADSVGQLRARAETVLGALDYRITAPPRAD